MKIEAGRPGPSEGWKPVRGAGVTQPYNSPSAHGAAPQLSPTTDGETESQRAQGTQWAHQDSHPGHQVLEPTSLTSHCFLLHIHSLCGQLSTMRPPLKRSKHCGFQIPGFLNCCQPTLCNQNQQTWFFWKREHSQCCRHWWVAALRRSQKWVGSLVGERPGV